MKRMVLLSVLLFFPFIARAATTQLSSQDRGWLIAAHQTNLAEIRAGQLAAQDGHTNPVRSVGRMLASDHQSLDAKLKAVAEQLGVKLPDHPTPKQQAKMQKFRGKPGMPFDRTWAHVESDGHIRAIELTEDEIHNGSSPPVKQLAAARLPVLTKHLQALQKALSEIRGNQ